MNHCYSGSLLGKLSLPPKIISKCVPMSHTIPATYLLHTQAVPFLKRSGRSCRALPWCRERAWMDVEGAPEGRRSRVGGGWRRRWGAPPKVQTSSCSCSYTIQQCQEEDWDREQAVIFWQEKTVRRKKVLIYMGFVDALLERFTVSLRSFLETQTHSWFFLWIYFHIFLFSYT